MRQLGEGTLLVFTGWRSQAGDACGGGWDDAWGRSGGKRVEECSKQRV